MQAVRPSFFGPQAPVMRRVGRLPGTARSMGARVPKRLRKGRHRKALTARRGLKRVASSAGALSVEQRLVQRITMGVNLAEMARVGQIGYDAYLEEQLDFESIDSSGIDDVIARAFPSLSLSAPQLESQFAGNQGVPVFELIAAQLYRAIFSPRQLYERMAIFWTDHFNIHLFADRQPLLKPVDDREVIRRHAMGKFPELLAASAHSSAMLIYLTNDSNVKGAPNENYARELMELHTLGVDNGYTQKDVREVARCFTGWTSPYDNSGEFLFDEGAHDNGTKRVLGVSIDQGGIRDGERVVEILAGSRRTAKYLARKMLVYFWGYEPKKRDVNRVAGAYMGSGGDIKAMLRQVLKKKRMQGAKPKLKRPFHLMASAMRGLFANLENPSFTFDALFEAGHLPFDWEPPDGYPDREDFWAGYILPRWNWASSFLDPAVGSGIDVDLDWIDPALSAKEIVNNIDAYLFNGAMTDETRGTLQDFLQSVKNIDKNRIRDAIGLAVASPEFQEY